MYSAFLGKLAAAKSVLLMATTLTERFLGSSGR